jgi:hypothetical protein
MSMSMPFPIISTAGRGTAMGMGRGVVVWALALLLLLSLLLLLLFKLLVLAVVGKISIVEWWYTVVVVSSFNCALTLRFGFPTIKLKIYQLADNVVICEKINKLFTLRRRLGHGGDTDCLVRRFVTIAFHIFTQGGLITAELIISLCTGIITAVVISCFSGAGGKTIH